MGSTTTTCNNTAYTKSAIITVTRRAHHAGSWYSSDPTELNELLTSYLQDAANANANANATCTSMNGNGNRNIPRAIISPHAGFSYSGQTAAYAYIALQEAIVARNKQKNDHKLTIVVLHPSHHHVYLDSCAVSSVDVIETPIGSLNVDSSLREEILEVSSMFQSMNRCVDEEEHSGEMQYPFIAKVIHDCKCQSVSIEDIQVLPIMVGALSRGKEDIYGKLLAPILARQGMIDILIYIGI